MTLTATTNKVSYSGNGSTTSFPVTFVFWDDDNVRVILSNDTTGVETVWTKGTQYNLTGGDGATGTLTVTTSPSNYTPASGETLTIKSNLPDTQSLSLPLGGALPSTSVEERLDKSVRLSQQLAEELSRAIQFSESSPATSTYITETATQRANKVLAFNSSGNLEATQEIGTYEGNWATSTAYTVRDIIKDTSNNNIYICITAHTSSGSQPISSNTDSAKWALIVDAASASTASSTATTKAAEASTSASNASTSEANALTYKNAAETAKTAAETAKTASETAYDNFDDRYLGQKSSDPSVDNDGASLLTGALYFNTSNNVMMVYTGSAWVRTTPTSSDQTNINALSASAVIADMALLADADVISDMNTLATSDIVSDLNTLATSDIVSDLNTLATSDVVNDMNVLGTSSNVTNMNTLAAVSANITTCAGISANITSVANNEANVNRYASEYTIASSAPSSNVTEGDLWFDTSNNVLKVYNGSSWAAVTSATAGITDVVDDTSPQLGGNLDLQTYTLSTAPLATGGLFSNPDTISTNTTITTSTTYNQVLFGPIAVTGSTVLTIAGSDQLNII